MFQEAKTLNGHSSAHYMSNPRLGVTAIMVNRTQLLPTKNLLSTDGERLQAMTVRVMTGCSGDHGSAENTSLPEPGKASQKR